MGLFNRQPQETVSTVTTTSIPEYAAPYYDRTLAAAEREANRPYQPYGDQRIAARPGDALQADYLARNMGGLGGLDAATSIYQNVAGTGANPPQYTAGQFGYDPVSGQQIDPSQFNLNAMDIFARQWGPEAAQQYMSPYRENVLDTLRDRAFQNWERSQLDRNTYATSTGNFGSGRHGIIDAMGREELTRQLAEIDATGMNNAWQQALQAFGGDRDAALAALQSNEAARLTAGRTGLEALLQSRLANQQTDLTGQQLNQAAGLQASQMGEQSRQFGAGLGLDYLNAGLQAQLGAAGGIANTQQLRDALMAGRINLLNQQGDRQFAYDQTGYDVAYQDFLNQRDYPRQNIAFMNSILQGLPVSPESNVTSYQTTNPLAQILGLGLAGLGAYQTYAN